MLARAVAADLLVCLKIVHFDFSRSRIDYAKFMFCPTRQPLISSNMESSCPPSTKFQPVALFICHELSRQIETIYNLLVFLLASGVPRARIWNYSKTSKMWNQALEPHGPRCIVSWHQCYSKFLHIKYVLEFRRKYRNLCTIRDQRKPSFT